METNSERRRRKLAEICAQKGLHKVAENAGLNWASLDQIIKKTLLPARKDGSRSAKNLGDDAARKIERAENLGEGWFDSVSNAIPATRDQAYQAQPAKFSINGISISPNALMLAQWLDDMPEGREKFMTFTECMALITRRLGSAPPSDERALLDAEETSSGESPEKPTQHRTSVNGCADHRVR